MPLSMFAPACRWSRQFIFSQQLVVTCIYPHLEARQFSVCNQRRANVPSKNLPKYQQKLIKKAEKKGRVQSQRNRLGEYVLSLYVSEDLQSQLTAIRDINGEDPWGQPEARAYLFLDIPPHTIDHLKLVLTAFVRKAHKADINVSDIQIEGGSVKAYVCAGKNELGNMLGRLKYKLQKKSRQKILKPSDQKILGSTIHWVLVKDDKDPERVQRCGEAIKNQYGKGCQGTALGLQLWHHEAGKRELVEVDKWEFSKSRKPVKDLDTEKPRSPRKRRLENHIK